MQSKLTKMSPLDMFRSHLNQILSHKHPLFLLAKTIDWSTFEKKLGQTYAEGKGRPGIPIRLMVGLLYLKHAFNESDETVVDRFVENPYWQYFCGLEYFTHERPIDPSSLTRFRDRLSTEGAEEMLREIINAAERSGKLDKAKECRKVNVDTTVQEKNITFPTDAKLYHKMREKLVAQAKAEGISLRQSYERLSKSYLAQQGRYAHAKQMKRSAKMVKKLKTFLGRVDRDIRRKISENPTTEMIELLELSSRLLAQEKHSKSKLYSLHAPEVECISKGKAHKRYEFGCKTGIVSSSSGNWILGIKSFHSNPYDGHTLAESIGQAEKITERNIKDVYVDLGYRGHKYVGQANVNVVDSKKMKKLSRTVKKWFKRRSAVEPVIGHLKSDHRMDRNYYKGRIGDQINALLSGSAYNMRKLIKVFLRQIRGGLKSRLRLAEPRKGNRCTPIFQA